MVFDFFSAAFIAGFLDALSAGVVLQVASLKKQKNKKREKGHILYQKIVMLNFLSFWALS